MYKTPKKSQDKIQIIFPYNHEYLLIEQSHEEEKVIKAISDIVNNSIRGKHSNLPINLQEIREKILADLSFGFWTTLLTDNKKAQGHYRDNIFFPCIKNIFPYAEPKNRDQKCVERILTGIRNLRNRVFHHEPIWDNKKLNLKQKHKEIHQVLQWINPHISHWLLTSEHNVDRFPTVYEQYREEIITLTQTNQKFRKPILRKNF